MKKKIDFSVFRCLFFAFLPFVLTLVGVVFASCQDEIYYLIEKEVKLESAKIPGDINGFTRLTTATDDYLYVENGEVHFKSAMPSRETGVKHGGWTKYSILGVKGKVYNIVADSKYIYIITSKWDDDEDINDDNEQIEKEKHIYCSEGIKDGVISPWQEVIIPDTCSLLPFVGNTDTIYTSMIFANNARQKTGDSSADAKAFVRLYDTSVADQAGTKTGGWVIKTLDGTTIKDNEDCLYPLGQTAGQNDATINCAFFVGGKTYFSDQDCAIVNKDDIVFTPKPQVFEGSVTSCGTDSDALSLAAVGDYVIAGTTGGIERYFYANGAVTSRDFNNNADTALTNYYEVPVVFALEPNRFSDEDTDMYAALTFHSTSGSKKQDHICLWACYSIRNKWNRE